MTTGLSAGSSIASSARRWAPTAILAVQLAGALAPWSSSGDAERNSFALVAVARRFGLLDGWEQVPAAAWYFLPWAVLTCALAALLGRPLIAAAVAAGAGLTGAWLVVVVGDLPFPDRPGRDVTLWASVAALAAAVLSSWAAKEDRRDRRAARQRAAG